MFFFSHSMPPEDCLQVSATASLLDVTEFRIFQLAYNYWYGHELSDQEGERCFTAFMFREVVPFWVRHYTKMVLSLDAKGELDRKALGVESLKGRHKSTSWSVTAVTGIVLSLVALVVLFETASDLMPFLKECYFPPCY